MPTIDALNGPPRKHLDEIEDLEALYKGGHEFRERLERFMPRRPDEAETHYKLRKSLATYFNYFRTIANFLSAYVFTDRMECVSDPSKPDDAYAAFLADADGQGTSFADMLKTALTQALVCRRHWILVDFPRAEDAPATAAEWDAAGLGAAYLCMHDDDDVLRYKADHRGALEWVVIKTCDTDQADPIEPAPMTKWTWTIYTRTEWVRYSIRFESSKPPNGRTDVPEEARGPCITPGAVPVVPFELPHALWAGDLLRDPAIENFRARAALSFSLARTCFAMRNFFLREDPGQEPKAAVAMGNVYGVDERVEWDAPPAEAFAPAAAYVGDTKDELFRVANNMALGVNNNAAAVGRSADSKAQDAAAMTVVAMALGVEVRRVAEKVLDLVARGRADKGLTWSVLGLDSYKPEDVATIVDAAVSAESLSIPSPTFARLHKTRVALALVPDASAEDRKRIAEEIEANVTDEEVLAPPPPPVPAPGQKPATPDPNADPETPPENTAESA